MVDVAKVLSMPLRSESPPVADPATLPDGFAIEVVCFEPGEPVETVNRETGALERQLTMASPGRVLGWRLGGVDCRTRAAFVAAVRKELVDFEARRANAPADSPQQPTVRLQPKAGTFYGDLASTLDVLKELGIEDIAFEFPGEPHPAGASPTADPTTAPPADPQSGRRGPDPQPPTAAAA